jgi:hypothetical protein
VERGGVTIAAPATISVEAEKKLFREGSSREHVTSLIKLANELKAEQTRAVQLFMTSPSSPLLI